MLMKYQRSISDFCEGSGNVNTHLYFFPSLYAAIHCFIAHIMTASGASIATNIKRMRRRKITNRETLGPGMLGWMASQGHEKMMARQFHMIPYFVRALLGEDMWTPWAAWCKMRASDIILMQTLEPEYRD
jgi:hypothetical protein